MALLELEQRIISDASNPALYAERAALYLAYDSTRQAENDLLRSIALDSMNAEYHLRLGEVYYLSLQLDKALARFERTIELDDKNTEARLKLAEMQLVLRQYARSMDMVNDALRIDPYVAHGYYLKGWIHKEIGDTTLSISSFRTAVEQDPTDYNAYVQLGLLHAARRDPLALEYYNTALELRPSSVEALYDKGMYCQENGMDSLALSCYAAIMELAPNNALAWYNSGFVRMEHLADLAQAKADFTKAFALRPSYHQAIYNRGVANERLGALDSAAVDYTRALSIAPDYDPAAEGLSRLGITGCSHRPPIGRHRGASPRSACARCASPRRP